VTLDAESMYRAMESRDRRFEGHFVIGVRTTGVYCRPGCPARIPRRQNVRFFASTAAAEEHGLRACLRCRPDASPAAPVAIGTPTTVARGVRLIADGALDEDGVDALAERLGVTGRHLRRLFEQHLGASPLAVARTRRVHFARKLLEETALPMTEVAHASGFASLRRFNDDVRSVFHATPTELRRRRSGRSGEDDPSTIVLRLPYRVPFAYPELLAFLGARAIPRVERVQDGAYTRTIEVGGRVGRIDVRQDADGRHLRLAIRGVVGPELLATVTRVRRLFDLDASPSLIDAHLSRDPRLAASVRARPGLRVPGAWDGFEVAVRAVLGQQVTVAGARTLAGRLVERFGAQVGDPGDGLTHVFPGPARLADADVAAIGLPRARAGALRGLARAMAGDPRAIESLESLAGVGPWTAAYVAMRAGRDPDAFPASDLVLRRALAGPDGVAPTARMAEATAEAWRPWRAYAALHLWTRGVER
jgi:AraC family transcriptional regulator, regulatory protein of adaptative response / DNA-3-methyladenine glycosylase II